MNKLSRRSLAQYAAGQLAAGVPANTLARYLASVLIESGRTAEVEFLLGDIAWELEHRGLLASAKVTTATPLSKELKRQIRQQVKKTIKADEVSLENRLDKSVVGGLRVETNTQVWDTTVRHKLNELKESI